MLDSSENLLCPPVPEIFPDGFEVMERSESPAGFSVRFFCADADGRQVGRDFRKIFDPLTFLTFMSSRRCRTSLAISPQPTLLDVERSGVFPKDIQL